jgi:hypothetical protein
MVRRGSTVRVRQRACKSAARRRFPVPVDLPRVERRVGMEPFMELSRTPVALFRAKEESTSAASPPPEIKTSGSPYYDA